MVKSKRKSNIPAIPQLDLSTGKAHFQNMKKTTVEKIPFLDGKLLVAMPGMNDPRFAKTVIFMCAHSTEGAMGLVINKPADDLAFADLMAQLKIPWDKARQAPKVHLGGPVEHGRGFVLHSAEYDVEDSTMGIGDDFGMTATLDILRDFSNGEGPLDAILTLGYTGWAPGQLEAEIQANGWVICDSTEELVFEVPDAKKWLESLKSLGFDPRLLSADGGSA